MKYSQGVLSDYIEFNPKENLPKGSLAKEVAMADLMPFQKKISDYTTSSYKGGMKFRNGDTLLARITPCLENGKTAYVDILGENEVGFGSTEYIVLRAIPQKTIPEFVFYLAISDWFRKRAIALMTGSSGRQRVQTDKLMNAEVDMPDLETQQKIVRVLSTLDQRIKLNNELIDSLYSLGDAIYETMRNDSSRTVTLKDISANYDKRRVPLSSRQREERRGKFPYYGATSILDYVDDYLFDGEYVLLGEDGTVMTKEGGAVLQYIWGKNWVNNHAHVLQGSEVSTEYLLFALRSVNVSALVTGAVQPKINQENMNKIKLSIGSEDEMAKVEESIKAIAAQIRNLTDENRSLLEMRDTLLPRLMSGEVDLDEVTA